MTAVSDQEAVLLLGANNPQAIRSALLTLAAQYPGKALVANEAVAKAVARLGDSDASPEERLDTIVFLVELRKKVKELTKPTDAAIKRLLQSPLAALATVSDPKAQSALALFLSQRKADWLGDYLASAAVRGSLADKARLVLVGGICRNAGTCSAVFDHLAGALRELFAQTEIQDREGMHRLEKLLDGLRLSVLKGTVAVDGRCVKALSDCVAIAKGARLGGERDSQQRMAVAIRVSEIANGLVAKRPVLLADQALSSSVGEAVTLTAKTRESPAVKKQLGELTERLGSALELCARQGASAPEIFFNLETICGSRESALKITKVVANSITGLPASLDRWLRDGEVPTPSTESAASDDHAIAVLLLRATEQQLEKAAPRKAELAVSVGIEALAVARKRGLEIVGSQGDEIDFDPLQHQIASAEGHKGGKVRIVVPGVVKRGVEGRLNVVLRAVVRPA